MAVGPGLHADPDVLLGYVPTRPVAERLVLGRDARLRSGSVLYRGSSIGARFETGHHVVVREQCLIGDDVSVWTGTVIDYGCRIGDSVKIHCNCYVAQFTEIDDGAFLAPGVTIANDLYPGDAASQEVMSGPHIGAGRVTHASPPGTCAMGDPGFEPGTSSLSEMRSNRLS